MTMTVRAKFKVIEIRRSGTPGPNEQGTIHLRPVTSGSPENEAFYRYTPAGEIVLSTVNAKAVEVFELGEEFYVDFTKAAP